MGKSVLLLAMLAAGGRGWTQVLPDAPSHHEFWDQPTKILFTVHAALEAADFAITHRNLSRGGRELNAMARPFCNRGTAGQSVFFAGGTAVSLGVSYALHRLGHHKLERLWALVPIVDSAYGVTYSFSHR